LKRSWSRIFALSMGIPLLLAILAACGSGTTTGNGGNTPTATGSGIIKIATELPVSGKDESSGKPAEDGAHLAVDQANANLAAKTASPTQTDPRCGSQQHAITPPPWLSAAY